MSCPVGTSNFTSGKAAADHARHLNLTRGIRLKRWVGGRCGLCTKIHVWAEDQRDREKVSA